MRWTFGESAAAADASTLAPLLRRRRPASRWRSRPSTPRVGAPDRASCATAEADARRGARPADPAPRVGADVAAGRPRLPRPLARHRRVQPVLSRATRSRSTATGPRATVDVPARLRRSARRRARRLPRRVLRLRDPAPQLRRRRGRQDDVAARSAYRRPTPLLTALRLRDRARGRRAPDHVDGSPAARRRRCCARRRWRRSPATAPTCPRCRRGRIAGVTADSRSTPATACRSPSPALLRARARRAATIALLVCDDDVADLRRRRARARPRSPAACWPPAPARARTSACCTRTVRDFVVGWLAAARIGAVTVPLSTFSTAAELRRAAAQRRHRDPAGAPSLPLARLRRQRCARPSPSSTSSAAPPAARRSVPALRRVALRRAGRRPSTRLDHATLLVDARPSVERRGARPRPKPTVTPGRPHGHRAHVGLDQRAEGRDPHPRRADPPPRQPQPAPPLHAPTRCCSPTRRSSGSAGSPTRCSARWSPARRSSARTRRAPPACSTCSSASGRRWSTASPQSVAHLPQRPVVRRPRPVARSGAATSGRSCRPTCGRPTPSCATTMLGMTEAGSVCLVSDDEGDQPEHRRGSFGRPAPGFEATVVDPETGARLRVRRGRASCGSAARS